MEKKYEKKNNFNNFMRSSTIKECILNGYGDCNSIIKAHSIQNNKYLNMISKDGKVEMLSYEIDEEEFKHSFVSIGRGVFSTFTGFCGKHDGTIFSAIENFEYSGTAEQDFLHVYRSIAREYHKVKEKYKMNKKSLYTLLEGISINLEKYKINDCTENIDIINEYNDFIDNLKENKYVLLDSDKIKEIDVSSYDNQTREYLIHMTIAQFVNSTIQLVDFGKKMDKLTTALFSKNFQAIKTQKINLKQYYPIVCSSSFIPYHSYTEKDIIDQKYFFQKQEFDDELLSLLILPNDKLNTTTVLIGYLDDRIEKLKIFEEINSKDLEFLKEVISFLIINNCENFALNPEYLNKFNETEKKQIIEEFYGNMISNGKINKVVNLFKD